MKKALLFSFLFFALRCSVFSQTITPDITASEYCPGTNYQFSVSITGLSNKASGFVLAQTSSAISLQPDLISGTIASSGTAPNINSTITFTVRFKDAYSPVAGFRVQYTLENTSGFFYTVDYFAPKVKGTPNATISPNISTINAGYCNTTPVTVSFPYLTYTTPAYGSTPSSSFGQITTYQYSLPVNWKVGTTASTDPNTWITVANSNSVTITPDGVNGSGASVYIRLVNCNGAVGPAKAITINRPALTVTGDQNFCTTSNDYSVLNLPTGSTISWSAAPAGIVNVLSPNSLTTKLSKQSNGYATLTATITLCGNTLTRSMSVYTGGLDYTKFTITPESSTICPNVPIGFGALYGSSCQDMVTAGITNITWTVSPSATSIQSNIGPGPGCNSTTNSKVKIRFPSSPTMYNIRVTGTNACGTSSLSNALTVSFSQSGCTSSFRFSVYPNPAKDRVVISSLDKLAPDATAPKFTMIQIFDRFQNLKKQLRFSSAVSSTSVNVSDLVAGMYTIRVFDGGSWSSQQLFISGK